MPSVQCYAGAKCHPSSTGSVELSGTAYDRRTLTQGAEVQRSRSGIGQEVPFRSEVFVDD
jgi:hypothetical protein